MASSPFLSVIVPAYNEVQRIAITLNEIQAYLDRQPYEYEIIVAADGNDGTRECVRELALHDPRLQVIGDVERGGKGRGIRNGVAQARGRIIGFADADNKTPIEELGKLLPWLERGYDIAFASRALSESKIEVRPPLYRRLGSRAFAVAMHLAIGLWGVHDTQCGFKFFRGDVARDIFSRQQVDGYMFDVEVLYLAEQSGYRMKEVGVRWHDDGDTRYDPVGGTWRNFKEIMHIRFAEKAISSPHMTQATRPVSEEEVSA